MKRIDPPLVSLSVTAFTLILVPTLSAQGKPGDKPAADGAPGVEDGAEPLPPIEVPGRRPQRSFGADRTVRTVPGPRQQQMQVMSAPEALQETAGVHSQTTNRGAGAPVLRGLIGPRNLLIVDGLRFNNATFRTGPNQYMSLLDPSSFAGYEVLMGPASVVYGSDAMGGVVAGRMRSWRTVDGLEGSAGTTFASADLGTTVRGSAGWRSGAAGAQASGAMRRYDTLTAGGGAEVPISDFSGGAWTLRGRFELGEHTALSVNWLGARIRDAGRIDRLDRGDYRWYDNDSDFLWLDLRHKGAGGTLDSLRLAATLHRTREEVQRFRCKLSDPVAERGACIDAGRAIRDGGSGNPAAPANRESLNVDGVLSPGALVQARLSPSDRVAVTVGGEGQYDTVASSSKERRKDKSWGWKDASRGNFSDGSTYLQAGAYALADIDLLRTAAGRLATTVGGRGAFFSARAEDVPRFGTVEYSHFGLLGSGGLKYVADGWMAYVNVSQGFRAPNLQESTVLGDTGSKIEVPNGDLSPESSLALELGVRLRGKRGGLHLVGFANYLDGVIDERTVDPSEYAGLGLDAADVGSKQVVQRVNRDTGRYLGGELTGRLNLVAGLVAWGQASYVVGDIDRPSGTVPVRRGPPPLGAAGLRWSPAGLPGLYLELFSRFAAVADRLHPSDKKDLRICEDPDHPGRTLKDAGKTCPGTPGWATANIRAGYRFSRQLQLHAAGLNLLDAAYRYHGSGYDEPGRGVRVSLTSAF